LTVRSKAKTPVQASSFIEQARRRQIIEAVIAGVAERGYAGASLGQVAERAKISKRVVLYHFAGKDELIETTVHSIYDEIWGFIRPRVAAEKNAQGRLRAYIEAEFAFLEQHRARLLTISYLLMNHRSRSGVLYLRDEAEKANLRNLGAMLEEGQKSGEFRAFALMPMAATLMHAINGALDQWAADPNLSLSEYARELTTIFDLATRKQSGRR
jgi:AcrR family transcriptional regulator